MSFNPVTKTCDTIAELRTLKGTNATASRVQVLGANIPGDGKAGFYYWSSTSNATDDGINIIAVTGVATGRYLRIISNGATLSNVGFSPRRLSNTLYEILDGYTGEYSVYNRVTVFGDGTTMTDAKVDGTLYIKFGTEYFVRQTNGELDVRWWGAVGNNSTDNTNSFNACASMIRVSTANRYTMKIPAGYYKTGKIDITGVYSIKGTNARTTVIGLPGQDVFYWKGFGEEGYSACTSFFMEGLSISVDDSTDVRSTFIRIGMGGEVIGNVAIHLPVSIRPVFKDILISSVNAPVSGAGNGCGGLFGAGAQYALTFSGCNNFQGLDYPLCVGTSDTYTPIKPVRVTGYDSITFKAVNTFSPGTKVALIYDTNSGSIASLNPRTLYYAVNTSPVSFQLSGTNGGNPIEFQVSGNPQIFAVPCGSDSIEYANDEWAWSQLRVTGKRVSFSVANLCESAIGHLVMQSNGVSSRILNFPSANRQYSVHVHMALLDTEGPAYVADLTGKEYGRIEGEYIYIGNGPYLAASTTNTYFTIATNNSTYKGLLVGNVNNISPYNYISLSGSRNDMWYKGDNNEDNIVDTGVDNMCYASMRPNGDISRVPHSLPRKSINKIHGGFWPDALRAGYTTGGYQSESVMFYPAISQYWQSSGVTPTDLFYLYDDPTIEVQGYVRKNNSGNLALQYIGGSNRNTFNINRYFPTGKWKLFCKIRCIAGNQNVTMGVQKLSGTGNLSVSLSKSITSTWTIIDMTLDTSTLGNDVIAQFYITSTVFGFDIAYFYIRPYDARSYTTLIDYGPNSSGGTVNVIDTAGTGSPEGVVTGAVSSTYRQRDGISGSLFWVKQSGTGNTGWVPLA